jgi:hypothetical protein
MLRFNFIFAKSYLAQRCEASRQNFRFKIFDAKNVFSFASLSYF